MDRTATFYSQPSFVGAGFPVFSGSRRQRGGSIFGSIQRTVLPIIKNIGKKVFKKAVGQAASVGRDVVGDILRFRNPKQTLITRGRQAAQELLKDTGKIALGETFGKLSQPSRKRAAPNSQVAPAPAKKRRKVSTAVKKKKPTNF